MSDLKEVLWNFLTQLCYFKLSQKILLAGLTFWRLEVTKILLNTSAMSKIYSITHDVKVCNTLFQNFCVQGQFLQFLAVTSIQRAIEENLQDIWLRPLSSFLVLCIAMTKVFNQLNIQEKDMLDIDEEARRRRVLFAMFYNLCLIF